MMGDDPQGGPKDLRLRRGLADDDDDDPDASVGSVHKAVMFISS